MPGPWNDATDRQLLLIMIHLAAPQLPKWEQVAALMGDGFTAEAVRQHFQKLRKQSTATFGPPGEPPQGTSPAAKSTPRKKAAGSLPTSAGKRKAYDESDCDELASPSKKQAFDS